MPEMMCPACGSALHRGSRPQTLQYKDRQTTVDMPGWYCDTCQEGVHDGQDMVVSDRALHRLKAVQEGLLTPEEIRRIRKKLHLTQEAAGRLIGGGPRAFQKYERGDLVPSRALDAALRLLDHAPESLNVLLSSRDARINI